MTYKKYCTYRTSHPDGFYYFGKGQVDKIMAGEYLGSGAKLNAAFNHPRFSQDSWNVQILESFMNENDAYEAERKLITSLVLSDPFCLNLAAGGYDGKPLSTMIKTGEYIVTPYINQSDSGIVIDGEPICIDSNGRYSLTDLWKLSATPDNKKPYFWLRTDSTKEIIQEIVKENESNIAVIQSNIAVIHPVNTAHGVGTFACKEMCYAYAMWLNPAFHLRVIRAFDSLYTTRPAPATQSVERLLLSAIEIGQSLGVEPRYAVRSVRKEILDATGVDVTKMSRYMD